MIRPDDWDPEIGRDPHRDNPRKPLPRAVTIRLNNIALALNAMHEQLTELRHELDTEAPHPAKRRKVE